MPDFRSAETSNAILDAIEAAFRPALPGARQTLGGLAYRAFIDGTIHKDNGDLDGQAMLIVPINAVVADANRAAETADAER
jgi:hypothetical protein